MSHEVLVKQGTDVVWKSSGGDYALSVGGLAVGKGRCGAKADLGATFAPRFAVCVEMNVDQAPTAGTTIEIYWAASRDNSTFPGGATGTDAPYKDGEEDEWKKQLLLIGAVVVTADGGSIVQTQVFTFEPPARYGCPVVINKTDYVFEGNEDDHRLTLTPLIDEIQ